MINDRIAVAILPSEEKLADRATSILPSDKKSGDELNPVQFIEVDKFFHDVEDPFEVLHSEEKLADGATSFLSSDKKKR